MSEKTRVDEGSLNDARIEIIEALRLFTDHVKYTMTLLVTITTAGLAVIAFGIQRSPEHIWTYLLFSTILFGLMSGISKIAKSICRRYYKIYAANYIYYARVHGKYGLIPHPWVEDLFEHQCLSPEILSKQEAVDIFIDCKESTDKHSYHFYCKIIKVFQWGGMLSATVAILVMIINLTSK